GIEDSSVELAIEVVPAEPVGSFRISVEGPGISTAKNESAAPYASFGDDNGDFRGEIFSEGAYTVKATPYSGRNATGTPGSPVQISFNITKDIPAIAGFKIIDAEQDESLFGERVFTDGISISSCRLSTSTAIEIIPDGEVGSIQIQVEGPGINTTQIEHAAPFASFGDDGDDFVGRQFSEGTYRITAIAYSERDGKGVAGVPEEFILEVEPEDPPTSDFTADPDSGTAPLEVNFVATQDDPFGLDFEYFIDFGDGRSGIIGDRFTHTYSEGGAFTVTLTVTDLLSGCSSSTSQIINVAANPSSVVGFQLVDADTDQPFADITQGTMIDTYRLPHNLAIEALVSDPVGSVRMEVEGLGINTVRNQSDAPYASFGDNNGDFNGKSFGEGSYTVRATPYSKRNATGTAGIPLEISFEIVTESSFLFIGASGTEADGEFPHFNVLVNDEFVGEASTSVELGEEFFFFFDIPAGEIETVKIQFDNDLQTATEDRNLTVNLLVINEGDPFFEAIFLTPYEDL
ncbi:MAG: carbohydrate-binding domain-containing protein, partial [Bacteroidota bacterium]